MLEIRKYPDAVLKKKSEEVKEITSEIKLLVSEMFKAMYENNGCGLAAPQIGVSKRIVVIDVGSGPIALINPKITKKSPEKILEEEGCLSLPGVLVKVKRAREVEVTGLDPTEDRKVNIKAGGLLAVAMQHEIDHLDGILLLNKVRTLRRWKLIKEMKSKSCACKF